MNDPHKERLGEAARDVLLAEALGDLHKLQEGVNEVTKLVMALKVQVDSQAQQEMVQVLDQKMNEFRHFQIPAIAAAKLQAHAEIFLRGVMAEIQRLVRQEFATQANKARTVLVLGVLCVGMVCGFVARSFF